MIKPLLATTRTLAILAVLLAPVAVDAATRVFVIRHTEKAADGTQDPPLTEAGQARASALAEILATEPLSVAYHTPYKRTRQTAEIAVAGRDVRLVEYSPADYGAVHAAASADPGAVLIVGHGNTVTPIVRALGGEAEDPDSGELDYGTMYELTFTSTGVETAVRLVQP